MSTLHATPLAQYGQVLRRRDCRHNGLAITRAASELFLRADSTKIRGNCSGARICDGGFIALLCLQGPRPLRDEYFHRPNSRWPQPDGSTVALPAVA